MRSFFENKRVFVTGHTGFKGSWLTHVLSFFGSEVYGFSLQAEDRSHYFSAQTSSVVNETIGNILNQEALISALSDANPDIVIHLAAQPIVSKSYTDPIDTINVNVVGTANVLEASLKCKKVPLVAIVTSDKCYENNNKKTFFSENDKMGGTDPYSASKACAEHIVTAYFHSFFSNENQSMLSLRGGNVIGGGDWGENRLIPDIISDIYSGRAPEIRNPDSWRPWQHVLDVVSGYLSAIVWLSKSPNSVHESFNIGPKGDRVTEVLEVANLVCSAWSNDFKPQIQDSKKIFKEANYLSLDISKALDLLDWSPKFAVEDAILETVDWYKEEYHGGDMKTFTRQQIEQYFYS